MCMFGGGGGGGTATATPTDMGAADRVRLDEDSADRRRLLMGRRDNYYQGLGGDGEGGSGHSGPGNSGAAGGSSGGKGAAAGNI
jgi:hypothetical protein